MGRQLPRPNPFATLLILYITGRKKTSRRLRAHFRLNGVVNLLFGDLVRLAFTKWITERVQDRYNLSVLEVFLRAFWLPAVPQNHIVSRWGRALQAVGHPFESDTAHQCFQVFT